MCVKAHDDVITWQRFLNCWPFVVGIRWIPLTKRSVIRSFGISMLSACTSCRTNNVVAGDLTLMCRHCNAPRHPDTSMWYAVHTADGIRVHTMIFSSVYIYIYKVTVRINTSSVGKRNMANMGQNCNSLLRVFYFFLDFVSKCNNF